MNVARKGGKAEAKLPLADTLTAGKGGDSGELDWNVGLISGLPCLLGFSASKRKKIQRSLPTWQGCCPLHLKVGLE